MTSDWSKRDADLTKKAPLPRFHAGIASATIVIAPVKATMTNTTANINCGQSTNLEWQTTDAVDVSIDNGVGDVAKQRIASCFAARDDHLHDDCDGTGRQSDRRPKR